MLKILPIFFWNFCFANLLKPGLYLGKGYRFPNRIARKLCLVRSLVGFRIFNTVGLGLGLGFGIGAVFEVVNTWAKIMILGKDVGNDCSIYR